MWTSGCTRILHMGALDTHWCLVALRYNCNSHALSPNKDMLTVPLLHHLSTELLFTGYDALLRRSWDQIHLLCLSSLGKGCSASRHVTGESGWVQEVLTKAHEMTDFCCLVFYCKEKRSHGGEDQSHWNTDILKLNNNYLLLYKVFCSCIKQLEYQCFIWVSVNSRSMSHHPVKLKPYADRTGGTLPQRKLSEARSVALCLSKRPRGTITMSSERAGPRRSSAKASGVSSVPCDL